MKAIEELKELRQAQQNYNDELVKQARELERKMEESAEALSNYDELIAYVGVE